MIDEIRQLAIFAKVADCGGITAASKDLGLSTSVVSHHMKELESRLGVALLYRSTRKMALTAEGKKVAQHARRMVESAERSIDAISKDAEEPSGELSISIASILLRSEVMDRVADFSIKFPRVSLSIDFSDSVVDLVAEGIDFAVRVGNRVDSSLKSRRIATLDRCLVARPQLASSVVEIDQLSASPWVGLSMLPMHRTFSGPRGKKKISFVPNTVVNSVDGACQLALRGCGIATPPRFLAEPYLESGELVELFPEWKLESLPIYGVWHANTSRTGLATRLKSFLLGEV